MKANQESNEHELCISCLQPNQPGVHFCKHYGTPLSTYSTIAPYEKCFALGDFARKVVRSKRWKLPIRIAFGSLCATLVFMILLGIMLP